MKNWPSLLSLFVFVAGIVGAYAAGVYTFREVGLYGGPVASGFYRERNPITGHRQLVHERVSESGARVRQLFTDDLTVQSAEVAAGSLSLAVDTTPGKSASARVGFSLRDDGVIDAWAVPIDADGLTRIEISTKRNGSVDRWERYKNGVLVRVDLDTNGNGKPDRWMTYQDGIQMEEGEVKGEK